jgi:energy-coupling factor transporter ATP-binding protein EcfA2
MKANRKKVTNFYTYQALVFNEFIGFHKGPHGVFYSCPYSKDPASPQCEEYTGLYIVQSLGNMPKSILRQFLLTWCFPILYTIAAAAFLSIETYDIKSEISKAPQSDTTFRQDCPEHPPSTQMPRLLLEINKLGLRGKHRSLFRAEHCKIIFEDVSIAFTPGKLSVLLGPSGSGKTSIVRTLSRRLKNSLFARFESMGTVTINGIPVSKDLSQSALSFVAQNDDSLIPCLTVRETLCYAAEMRLPPSMSRKRKRSRAEEVMGDLGLINCANSLIGSQAKRGISGGEKRRVSIAIQLLKDPPIIVLDEPTSGLDVFNAKSVIDVLKTLADGGRTVIMTLHQPRSEFQCGLNTNPADFALDLITVDLQQVNKETASRERVDRLVNKWRIHSREIPETGQPFCERRDPPMTFKREANGFWQTFQVVMSRSILSIRRNRTFTIARISQVVGTSLLYALAYSPLRSNVEFIQARMVRV